MREVCLVCGQDYGLVHSCPGAPPPAEPTKWIPPFGFAPLYYLRQAVAIIKLEDDAIVQASRDRNALFYGGAIWSLGVIASGLGGLLRALPQVGSLKWIQVGVGSLLLLLLSAVILLAQYGLTHSLARWWLGAKGSFMGVLRAMLMGSLYLWLFLIPVIGTFAGGLLGICILMKVFEEVDRIERLKAFALAFASGIIVQGFLFLIAR